MIARASMHHLRQVVFAGLRVESIFAVTMMAATAFGFAKTILLATLMPVEAFGAYITAFGGATLLAMLLSLGDMEATYKHYPQLVATGRSSEIVSHARRLFRRLLVRVVVVFAFAVPFAWIFAPFGLGPMAIGVMVAASFTFLLLTLMASIIRAVDSASILPPFTAARGLATLVATVPVAVATESWYAVLLVEAAALVFVFCGTALVLRRARATHLASSNLSALPSDATDDPVAGRLMYYATLISALIPYGGRWTIIALEGPAMAGALGLLNVMVQIAQLLAGTLSQKLGPALMREAILRGDGARMGWLQRFGLPILFLWCASALIFVGTVMSFAWPAGAAFWQRYGITIPILGITALQMAMSAYLYLFFAVVSENREIDLVRGAIASVLVFYGGVKASAVFEAGLLGYALAAAAAYTTYTLYLFVRYRKVLRANV